MGVVLKKVYGKDSDFLALTSLLGTKRLQCHLTDKAYLLPPNMRTIARFMNMSSMVIWGNQMLDCLDNFSEEMHAAYSFLKDYASPLRELRSVLDATRHIEDICKNEGFSILTSHKCKSYIIANVIGNAYSRQAKVGLKMLEYFEYGVTSFALIIPLCPKITNKIVTETFKIKERLVNIKLKDVDVWRTKHLSRNWVTERTNTLKKVG